MGLGSDTATIDVLAFGSFQLDLRSRELHGPRGAVRLQRQPCQILELLVRRRGRVVTRDELHRYLWPDGTFVDVEHSLNAAIKRLRAVLDDATDASSWIETIPRSGYRLRADPGEPARYMLPWPIQSEPLAFRFALLTRLNDRRA